MDFGFNVNLDCDIVQSFLVLVVLVLLMLYGALLRFPSIRIQYANHRPCRICPPPVPVPVTEKSPIPADIPFGLPDEPVQENNKQICHDLPSIASQKLKSPAPIQKKHNEKSAKKPKKLGKDFECQCGSEIAAPSISQKSVGQTPEDQSELTVRQDLTRKPFKCFNPPNNPPPSLVETASIVAPKSSKEMGCNRCKENNLECVKDCPKDMTTLKSVQPDLVSKKCAPIEARKSSKSETDCKICEEKKMECVKNCSKDVNTIKSFQPDLASKNSTPIEVSKSSKSGMNCNRCKEKKVDCLKDCPNLKNVE